MKFHAKLVFSYFIIGIGKGAYGVVWKGLDKKTRKSVAIKKTIGAFKTDKDAQKIYREIMYLSNLPPQDNIIQLLDLIKDETKDELYLVFDYIESDLHAVIRAGILEEKHVKYIILQILQCIRHLHNHSIIHRDLKPSNILLSPECEVKVADFGNVRSLKKSAGKSDLNLTKDIGTRWYSAPEVLLGSKSYGKPVDMWSLGCLLAEILSGKPLFRGGSTAEQVGIIFSIIGEPTEEDMKSFKCSIPLAGLSHVPKKQAISLEEIFPNISPDCFDFLQRLLMLNPQKRMTVETALEHPFIKNFLEEQEISAEESKIVDVELDISDTILKKSTDYKQLIYKHVKERQKTMYADDFSDPILKKLTYLRYIY